MLHACAPAASGVIGNELFLSYHGNGDLLALQIYNFTTREWRLGAPWPRRQHCPCGVVVGAKLYLVSVGTYSDSSTFVYDVQSDTWTEQRPPPDEARDLQASIVAGSGDIMHAFAHDGRIVVVKESGSAFHRGTGSADWSPLDLDIAPPQQLYDDPPDEPFNIGFASVVGGSVLL